MRIAGIELYIINYIITYETTAFISVVFYPRAIDLVFKKFFLLKKTYIYYYNISYYTHLYTIRI